MKSVARVAIAALTVFTTSLAYSGESKTEQEVMAGDCKGKGTRISVKAYSSPDAVDVDAGRITISGVVRGAKVELEGKAAIVGWAKGRSLEAQFTKPTAAFYFQISTFEDGDGAYITLGEIKTELTCSGL